MDKLYSYQLALANVFQAKLAFDLLVIAKLFLSK